MNVSVAMTTYNGQAYIIEQLESIRNQSLSPNEVIICDDISTDKTRVLVEEYIKKYNLYNWHFVINEHRLGWKENFRNAISRTNGDVVFFSDQDDIWFENKIRLMCELMERYSMGCLYGGSIKIDNKGNYLDERNLVNDFSGKLIQIKFNRSFFAVGGLGCCMCVSRRVIDKYIDLNYRDDDHDSQCPRIAVYYDTLWKIDKPVIKYRIHENNTSGISSEYSFGSADKEKRLEEIKTVKGWLELVSNEHISKVHNKYVYNAIEFEDRRIQYFTNTYYSFIRLIPFLFYYQNFSTVIGDFAYKHKLNKSFGKVRWKIEKLRSRRKKFDNKC